MFDAFNGTWALFAAAGALLAVALYVFRWSALGRKRLTLGALTLVLGAALAFLFGKLFYLVMTLTTYLSRHGFPVSSPMEWSFFGAMTGVCLAVYLSARLMKENGQTALSYFAPSLLLIVAFLRAAEFTMDQVGLGEMVETTALQFFPVCWPFVLWGTSTWYMAVFAWETAFALLLCAVCLLRQHRGGPSSYGMDKALFYLCLGQMLFESLRAECIRLGFVRLEQVLCAVVCFALGLMLCLKNPAKGFMRWLPALLLLAGIGAMVGLEFALDEPSYIRWVVYALIILTLFLMGLVYYRAGKKARVQ